MRGLDREPLPGSRHVDQDSLHCRIWCALRHLPTFSGSFSALSGSNHHTPTGTPHRTIGRSEENKSGWKRDATGKMRTPVNRKGARSDAMEPTYPIEMDAGVIITSQVIRATCPRVRRSC